MQKIIVFGSGCPTCHKLKMLVENVIKENNISAQVEYSDDYAKMAKLGILSVPAIVIDGQVKSSGNIPKRDEILSWFK